MSRGGLGNHGNRISKKYRAGDDPRVALRARVYLEHALANPVQKPKPLPSSALHAPKSLVAPFLALVDSNEGKIDEAVMAKFLDSVAASSVAPQDTSEKQKNRGVAFNAKRLSSNAIYNAQVSVAKELKAEKKQQRVELQTILDHQASALEGPQKSIPEPTLRAYSVEAAPSHQTVPLENLICSLQGPLKISKGQATRNVMKSFLAMAQIPYPEISIHGLVEHLKFFLDLSGQKVTEDIVEKLLKLAKPKPKKTIWRYEKPDLGMVAKNSATELPAQVAVASPISNVQTVQYDAASFMMTIPGPSDSKIEPATSLRFSKSLNKASPPLKPESTLP